MQDETKWENKTVKRDLVPLYLSVRNILNWFIKQQTELGLWDYDVEAIMEICPD